MIIIMIIMLIIIIMKVIKIIVMVMTVISNSINNNNDNNLHAYAMPPTHWSGFELVRGGRSWSEQAEASHVI